MLDQETLLEIQDAVLGSLMLFPKSTGETIAELSRECFDEGVRRNVYDAAVSLYQGDAPVDPVTLQTKLGGEYGKALLHMMDVAPREADLPYHRRLLLDYGRLASLRSLGLALAGCVDLEEAEALVDQLHGAQASRPGFVVVDAHKLVSDYLLALEDRTPPPEYMTFGLPMLDERTTVEQGDFIVVGGYASAGKTLLSLQFAEHMAARYRVGYFSLETNEKKLGERLIARLARVPLRDVKTRRIDDEAKSRIYGAGMTLGDKKGCLQFIRGGGIALRDIQAITLSRRYQVVFVDYLQLLEGEGRTTYEKITGVSKGLHTLAQRYGVTVVALAQLSRPERVKGKAAPPTMWSFKESGQIENDADVAMLLYPSDPDNYRSPRMLKLSKNKDGEKGEAVLEFDGPMQTLIPARPDTYKAVREACRRAEKEWKERQVAFEDLPDNEEVPF